MSKYTILVLCGNIAIFDQFVAKQTKGAPYIKKNLTHIETDNYIYLYISNPEQARGQIFHEVALGYNWRRFRLDDIEWIQLRAQKYADRRKAETN